MSNLFKRMGGSLLLRLALIMLLAAVVLNIATYQLFFRFQQNQDTAVSRNLVQYAHYLMAELGDPPDRAKAEDLGERLLMRITVRQGQETWSAGHDGPFPAEHLCTWYANDIVEAGSLHGYKRIQMRTAPDASVTFDIYPSRTERAAMWRFGAYYLILTALVLLGVYWSIRYCLRPVRWLAEGSAAVRDGDLSHRVPERRGGELRDLARTFNEMVDRLSQALTCQKDLLLGVSHELRTPLTRLRLHLAMMPPDEGIEERTKSMAEDMAEMEFMINALLEAARMEHRIGVRPQESDVVEILAEAARARDGQAPGVVTDLPPGPMLATVDPGALYALAANLLDNALKYSAPGAGPVLLSLNEEGEDLVIRVRDQGVGIAQEAQARVFEPFYRVDESRTRDSGGYGLGLSMCRTIALAHGGEIGIESELGRGTTVTVRLPRRGDVAKARESLGLSK